jgi:hypothetical protein
MKGNGRGCIQEKTAVIDFYEVSVTVYFVPEG